MIHLWATAGSGRYPVCGAEGVKRGERVTEAYYRDLCRGCRAYQERKSANITQRIRTKRREA